MDGIKFLSEPFKIGTGNAVEFEDPFGNRLGVTVNLSKNIGHIFIEFYRK